MVIRKCVFLNFVRHYFLSVIRDKEKAESAVKSALELPRAKVGVPYNDFNRCINQYILST